jgi:hypothetical protein
MIRIDKDIFGNGTTIVSQGQRIFLPFVTDAVATMALLPLYDNFNQRVFDKEVSVVKPFEPLCNLVYDVFGQERPKYRHIDYKSMQMDTSDKNVVLGFSGGLDSCYQAILLKEQGYDVHLFHVKGIHGYEGYSEMPAVESFAKKMDMDLIVVDWKRDMRKDNKHRPSWGDNAIKNQLIECMMIDYCMLKGWNKISLGDDESISVYDSDAKCGINITDCREVQGVFVESVKEFVERLVYIGIQRKENSMDDNKYNRIEKLAEYGCVDDYYSCVGSGRFNGYNHSVCEKKHNVSLHRYNCGCYCTKCAIHNLLLHYVGNIGFDDVFIDKCWERLWNTEYGNFEELFGKDVPLETRIDNLKKY